jgi:hypothetical protein
MVEVVTPAPVAADTPLLTHTATPRPDLWEIQKCGQGPSVIPGDESTWTHQYVGDIEERGEMDMLLFFTKNNEIQGFAFDFEQAREYRINGCVDRRAFTMWLQQGDIVEAVMKGEFPEKDPRSHFSSSDPLTFAVITGSLVEKSNPGSFQTYFRMTSSTAGTMEHRFELAGVEDDDLIVNASQQFINAVINDDRAQVIEMIRFPVEVRMNGAGAVMNTPEKFLSYYNAIFGDGFKERLAITFPNYLWPNAGNFLGTISQSIYGGGGIVYDEHGKVIGIYNWVESTPTPSADLTP